MEKSIEIKFHEDCEAAKSVAVGTKVVDRDAFLLAIRAHALHHIERCDKYWSPCHVGHGEHELPLPAESLQLVSPCRAPRSDKAGDYIFAPRDRVELVYLKRALAPAAVRGLMRIWYSQSERIIYVMMVEAMPVPCSQGDVSASFGDYNLFSITLDKAPRYTRQASLSDEERSRAWAALRIISKDWVLVSD